MMELTKERLQQIVHAAGLEPWDYEEVFDGITTGEIVMMARQLLAGMEQDPVAYIAKYESGAIHGTCDRDDPVKMEWLKRGMVVSPLYAAPQLPQPAVVPTFDEWCAASDNKPLGWVKDVMREAYDGCRAAMLHGGKS